MKTLEDLVEELNSLSFLDRDAFRLKKGAYDEMLDIHYKNSPIISFDLEHGKYCFTPAIPLAPFDAQRVIVKYLDSHKAEEWLAEKEKKYNVILMHEVYNDGRKDTVQLLAKHANHKCYTMFVPHLMLNDVLHDERYQFTEKEIEEVKSVLPLNMQQIIDLGKVEIENA